MNKAKEMSPKEIALGMIEKNEEMYDTGREVSVDITIETIKAILHYCPTPVNSSERELLFRNEWQNVLEEAIKFKYENKSDMNEEKMQSNNYMEDVIGKTSMPDTSKVTLNSAIEKLSSSINSLYRVELGVIDVMYKLGISTGTEKADDSVVNTDGMNTIDTISTLEDRVNNTCYRISKDVAEINEFIGER